MLAIRILVERGSDYALRDDVAERARELVLRDPAVLRKFDPAASVTSLKLPGVIDILADNQVKRAELAELVDEHHATSTRKLATLEATVNSNHAATPQSLADETGALAQAFIDGHRQLKQDYERRIAILGSNVIANKAASDLAFAKSYIVLWKYFAELCWQLTEDHDAQKSNFDEQIAALQASHAKETQDVGAVGAAGTVTVAEVSGLVSQYRSCRSR